MKVYFMSSPRGEDALGKDCEKIYRTIEELGHTHTTDFLLRVDVSRFYSTDIDDVFSKTLQDLKRADVCVFEVSTPSFAIGYLVHEAIQEGKPVVILYVGKTIPHFLKGIHADSVQVIPYDMKTLRDTLAFALNCAKDSVDVRFNFFISPPIVAYLDWVSKHKNIPRSVYLRNLIERDMNENTEFQEGKAP